MKIVAVVGSPRHGGNTDIIVDRMITAADRAGAEVTKYFLNDFDLRPCQACEGCRPEVDKPCVLKDDMQPIHRDLRVCDGLILGTPIYWFGPSAQFTIFLNRWYALGGDDDADHALTGVRAALALAYADPDPYTSGAMNAYAVVRDAINWLKGTFVGVAHASAGGRGEVQGQPQVVERAEELGRKLASG